MARSGAIRWTLTTTLVVAAVTFASCTGGGENAPASKALPPDLQAVLEQVSTIRGLPAPTGIRAGAITREQVSRTLKATLTDGDRQAFAHLTTLYRLLGHLGPGEEYEGAYLAFAGDALIGFYAPKDRALWVVTPDGGTVNFESLERQEQSTIAHELTHALQDGSFDVQALFAKAKDDLDWILALNAVLEGDAVNIEGAWTRQYALRPVNAVLAAFGQTESAPVSIERELRFPYTNGPEWVSIVRTRSGNGPIDNVLRGQRLTTAEIIHPGLFEAGFRPETVTLPDLTPALGDGWKHTSGGAFGEFQLRNYLQLELTALPATQAATGWAGDRYDVYSHGAEAVAAFHVLFSSPDEASEFITAQDAFFEAAKATVTSDPARKEASLPDGRTTIRAAAPGAGVVFVIGSNANVARAAFDALMGS